MESDRASFVRRRIDESLAEFDSTAMINREDAKFVSTSLWIDADHTKVSPFSNMKICQ
jgi:hypothetical protein